MAERSRLGVDPSQLVDLVVASVMLVVTAPIMAVLAVLIRLCMGSPVFLGQPEPARTA